jgi:HNH endonuclease
MTTDEQQTTNELTAEEVRHWFNLDESTGVLTWKRNPAHCNLIGKVAGCSRKDGRWKISLKYKSYLRSRIVFLFKFGWLPDEIDHKDRDSTNDRPDNLRAATSSQNKHNSKGPGSKLGRLKGTYRDFTKVRTWASRIHVKGKKKHLGFFHTMEEAHAAYCEAAHDLRGEFVCTSNR